MEWVSAERVVSEVEEVLRRLKVEGAPIVQAAIRWHDDQRRSDEVDAVVGAIGDPFVALEADGAREEGSEVLGEEGVDHAAVDAEGVAGVVFGVEGAGQVGGGVVAVVEDEGGAGGGHGEDAVEDGLGVEAVLEDVDHHDEVVGVRGWKSSMEEQWRVRKWDGEWKRQEK